MIMDNDRTKWLNNIKTVAMRFIEGNLPEESPFFESFWHVFAAQVNKVITSEDPQDFSLSHLDRVVTDISLVKGYAQDFITPIVTLTIAEVMHAINTKKHTEKEIEAIIHSSSVRHGAKPSLTACLIRSLPSLCNEISACKGGHAAEAVVSQAPRPSEYLIWTEGKKIILGNMDNYEKNKDKYLLWINLDNPARELTPKSIRLLIHLVENIGIPISISDILKDVFDDTSSLQNEEDINKINQQLVKLEKFSGSKFRQYLMAGWPKESLGLSDEFHSKYFLFRRAVSKSD